MSSVNSVHPGIPCAVSAIQSGGVVAYPTEAVYGLGCDPKNLSAIERILDIKQRPKKSGFILLAANQAMLRDWVDYDALTEIQQQQLNDTWPGPLTWICPAKTGLSPLLTGQFSTVAVRVTAHPLAASLSEAVGHPIISTSANLSGHPPALSAIDVSTIFDNAVNYILEGELGGQSKPTEIRDLATGQVIRSA